MKIILKVNLFLVALFSISACTKTEIRSSHASSNSLSKTTGFTVGQKHGGGIIFYVDSTGLHGLIANKEDIGDSSAGTPWAEEDGDSIRTGATGDGIGAGLKNTNKIVKKLGGGLYAANLCKNFRGGGHNDWYLPSKGEMASLCSTHQWLLPELNLKFTDYWTSTEQNFMYAWSVRPECNLTVGFKNGTRCFVRPIRKF